jgi:hypothetical protein
LEPVFKTISPIKKLVLEQKLRFFCLTI